MLVFILSIDQSLLLPHPVSVCLLYFLKAWLTEIHEYAQKDVVIMLLGNKVSEASFFALHKKIWRITGPLAQF